MRAYERLLNYVRVYTTSDPESGTHPSAAREFDLAHQLVEELKALGVEDARVDEHCYVYGSLPATPGCEDKPALGLIAHMDTAPDASGENVNPILHENYDGGDVTLPATGMVMKVSAFPFLASMKGETLITTDGTTLLGADDKAGVAGDHDRCGDGAGKGPAPRQAVHRLYPRRGDRRGCRACLTFPALGPTLPTPWTAAMPVPWNTRTSTPLLPP